MIPELEALIAVSREGSTVAAATALRVSQSTVSKRLSSLAAQAGVAVVEPRGRGLVLTRAGRRLVEEAAPLLAALRQLFAQARSEGLERRRLTMGVTESLLASWAPEVIARLVSALPGIEPELHAHRGPVAADRVRSGQYDLALVAGSVPRGGELRSLTLGEEEMVLVAPPGRPPRLARGRRVAAWTIEAESATWRGMRRSLREFEQATGVDLRPERRLESFAPLVQLARAGFGTALVPAGLALALGLRPADVRRLPRPRVHRPIRLVGRRRLLGRPDVAPMLDILQEVVPRVIAERAHPEARAGAST